MKRVAAVVVAAANLTVATSLVRADLTADQTPFHTYRGLWVSRFEYSNTVSSVDAIFANAQAMGITDVMFQVRGRADAFYTPKQVNGSYFEHNVATFDALARAIQQGEQRGIKVHAWLNMMPLWSGTSLPNDQPGNPYVINTHPEYWIRDGNNNPQPLNSSYVIVNPTMPEVKQHLYEVVDDITSKYNVAGIHMDYIRYLNNTGGAGPVVYPTDPASVARFQAIPGNEGKTPQSHKADYQAWMAENVNEIVAGVRQTMKANLPEAQLTAAVWRDANIGYRDYQQDWKVWVEQGLLDAAMPMIYRKGFGSGGTNMDADSGNLYRNNTTAAVNWTGTSGIMPGLGIYLQDNASTAYNNTMAQLLYAQEQGANGVQLFSYTTLLGNNSVQQEVRRAWLDFVAATGAAPPVAVITDFEADSGYFPTTITFSGSNINVASSSSVARTDEAAHGGDFSQKLTINTVNSGTFLARHVSGIGTPAHPSANLEFPSIGAIGFWLMTDTPDIEVAVALDDRADNSSTERSYFQNVISDGQWHHYEWFLNDPTHWNAWAGANRDGKIDAKFWLDSIQFRGSESANILFLDDIFYDAVAVAPNQWTLNSAVNQYSPDTNWSNGANWQGGIPNAPDAVANFLRRATGNQTITVDAPVTVGHLTFDNINSYTLTGPGSVTMAVTSGDASITVRNRGVHIVAVPVNFNDNTTISVDHKAALALTAALNNAAGRTLTKVGNGTLVIDGAQTHALGAVFNARGGTTNFNSNAGSAAARNLLLTAENPDSRVNLNTTQHVLAVSVSDSASVALSPGGDKVLSTRSATTSGGRLDLADNGMIVDYTAASPIADIRAQIASAHAGGTWSGDGITTSVADADHGLGYAEAADLFGTFPATFLGEEINDTSVVVRFTRYGDADLDGQVNLADFNRLAANFGSTNAFWQHGDFNYDGIVNLADFNLLAANFGLAASAPDGPTPDDWAALGAAVPEPGVLGLAGVAASAAMLRRRSTRGLRPE